MPYFTWEPHIIAHAGLAATCVVLGATLLVRKKGITSHRILGWTWVILMMTVALISFWIKEDGKFVPIHVLSVITPIMLVLGVYRARTHQVKKHRSTMIGIYVGAMLIAGAFTFMPNRLIGHWVWQQLGLLPQETIQQAPQKTSSQP
jgi:uncharacterized membrane protein